MKATDDWLLRLFMDSRLCGRVCLFVVAVFYVVTYPVYRWFSADYLSRDECGYVLLSESWSAQVCCWLSECVLRRRCAFRFTHS